MNVRTGYVTTDDPVRTLDSCASETGGFENSLSCGFPAPKCDDVEVLKMHAISGTGRGYQFCISNSTTIFLRWTNRHDFFWLPWLSVSDHGLEEI